MKYNFYTLIKPFWYQVISFSIIFLVSYLISKNLAQTTNIILFIAIFQILNYFSFHVIWDKIFEREIKPCVIWMTGLSGAGKTTIAHELIKKLERKSIRYVLLDGDEIRKIVKNTGFDYESRKAHNINVAYIASLLEKQGNVVVVSLISPYREVREECRNVCHKFIEVFVDTPLDVCEKRDVKGLYKKARAGEVKEFTGISSPYEIPLKNEIHIYTPNQTIKTSALTIFKYIVKISK